MTAAEPMHPHNDTIPDGVDLLERAGMAAGRTGLVDGPELSLILVLAALQPDEDRVAWAVVSGVYEAGRLVGILQAQADVRGCRAALDAAADQGYEWAKREMVGGPS